MKIPTLSFQNGDVEDFFDFRKGIRIRNVRPSEALVEE